MLHHRHRSSGHYAFATNTSYKGRGRRRVSQGFFATTLLRLARPRQADQPQL